MVSSLAGEKMTLREFLKMWRADLTVEKIIPAPGIAKVQNEDFCYLLYYVLYKKREVDYGRHAGLRIKVNRITKEILEHDIVNMTQDARGNWIEKLGAWFIVWTSSLDSTTTVVSTT